MTGYESKKAMAQDKLDEEDDDTQVYKRPWVEPTSNEWFNWWRVSQVADATEAEIDFADFLLIAQAVTAKLKENNNG